MYILKASPSATSFLLFLEFLLLINTDEINPHYPETTSLAPPPFGFRLLTKLRLLVTAAAVRCTFGGPYMTA